MMGFKFKGNQKLSVLVIVGIVVLSNLVKNSNACNIWSASSCRDRITKADLELMKSDDYSKQELYDYCDKGKAYVDCVNEKLKCCDLRDDLFKSLKAFDTKLEKYAWKLAPYCSGIGTMNVAHYRCRTTTRETTSTIPTTVNPYRKPELAACEVKKAGEKCNSYLDGRVQWDKTWNVYDKMQWCRDTIDYVNCANQFLINCDITFVRSEADQLQSFIDFISKASNINCPGGIKGCENTSGDMRCILGTRYFLGEYSYNKASTKLNLLSNNLLVQLIFICTFFVRNLFF